MKKSDFTLFFSLPLDAQDWANLAASHVTRVMLPLDLADTATLDRLHSMGIRVVLRVGEDRYYADDAPARIVHQVQACQNHASIVLVVVGVEPDGASDFRYGAPSWDQAKAYSHRDALTRVYGALHAAGFTCASPGWRMRMLTEAEPPEPGAQSWAEIVRLAYDACDFNAVHLYTYNWLSAVDRERVQWALQRFATTWHKQLCIDEVGVGSGSAVARMRAYMQIADMLVAGPLSDRVALLCPFVSNGNPSGWPAGYLMRDPACYVELGRWMTS